MMENKLKLRTFTAPLISLFSFYLIFTSYSIIARGNFSNVDHSENQWWGIAAFIIFIVFMIFCLSLGFKMLFSSIKTLRFKNLGGFSKMLRLLFSISLTVISTFFLLLLGVLIILVFTQFDRNDYIDYELSRKIGLIGVSIIKGIVGTELGLEIDGFTAIFWIMFALALVWCGGGIIAKIFTSPRKSKKAKKINLD